MNSSDFADVGLYDIYNLSESNEKNYPHPYNVGDYHVLCVNDNPGYQILMMFSPRLFANSLYNFYIGCFWDGIFSGWVLFNGTHN